ncbi:SMI1/KNR4 family protein [Nocardia sp. BMG111209]|uniref:SMI1/KNR4 family protein n=1 Tax=Nocardia sp. BMG111209 TaxID=1160137 RepID=UPI0003763823|nr:SMI1/KNR4 family protein [Nocardia sp. BMG111209]
MTDTPAESAPRTADEWRTYLPRYGEVYVRTANEYIRPHLTPEQLETHWFGTDPASEQTLAATALRLGIPLPRSLAAFLSVTDGWKAVGGWIDAVAPCAEIDWLRNTQWGEELIEIYTEEMEEDDYPNEPLELFRRTLLIASGEDIWLLDPTRTDPDGEYTAIDFTPKYGDYKEYPSFAALFHESKDLMIRLADARS